MSPARARTQTARSGVEHTKNEATEPLTSLSHYHLVTASYKILLQEVADKTTGCNAARSLKIPRFLWSSLIRVTDSKYRESLERFEKSKTLKLCLKNAFRELFSKIVFRFSKNLTSSRNSHKTKMHFFTTLNMQINIGKIDKVLGIRIETIYNFRKRDQLSIRTTPFFYLTLGSFNLITHFEGFCRLYQALDKKKKMRNFTGFKCILDVRCWVKTSAVQKCIVSL